MAFWIAAYHHDFIDESRYDCTFVDCPRAPRWIWPASYQDLPVCEQHFRRLSEHGKQGESMEERTRRLVETEAEKMPAARRGQVPAWFEHCGGHCALQPRLGDPVDYVWRRSGEPPIRVRITGFRLTTLPTREAVKSYVTEEIDRVIANRARSIDAS